MSAHNLADLAQWDRRNLWQPTPDTIEVRPGTRRIVHPGYDLIGATSVKSPTSGMTHHFLVSYDPVGTNTRVRRYDENLDQAWDDISLPVRRRPRTVTFALNGQEMLIGSPDFAIVRAVIGGHMEIAAGTDSENEANAATLDTIPNGIVASWRDRMVIAAQPTQDTVSGLFFSAITQYRSFPAQNFLAGPWASPVHGLHVCPAGLVVCAETGVWLVPDAVVTAGELIDSDVPIMQLSGVGVYDFGRSCQSRGEVWILTRRGLLKVWPNDDQSEIQLSERRIPRSTARIHSEDWRARARLVGGSDIGPIVSYEDKMFLLDRSTGHRGWWTRGGSYLFDIVGVLHEPTGEELLVSSDVVYRVHGNFDGGNGNTEDSNASVTGFFAGALPTVADVDHNVVATKIKVAGTGSGHHAVNGREVRSVAVKQKGGVEGVATWEATDTYADMPLLEQNTAAVPRGQGSATEVAVEVGASGAGARILPVLEAEDKAGRGKRDRGNG